MVVLTELDDEEELEPPPPAASRPVRPRNSSTTTNGPTKKPGSGPVPPPRRAQQPCDETEPPLKAAADLLNGTSSQVRMSDTAAIFNLAEREQNQRSHLRRLAQEKKAGTRLVLDEEERRDFDCITYEAICAIDDVGKLFRLERYMREEGYAQTATAARERLIRLGELPTPKEEDELRRAEEREEKTASDDMQSWLQSMKNSASAERNGSAVNMQNSTSRTTAGAPPVRSTGALPVETCTEKHTGGETADIRTNESSSGSQQNATITTKKENKVGDVRSGAEYYREWDRLATQLETEEEMEKNAPEARTDDRTAVRAGGGSNSSGKNGDEGQESARELTDDEWATGRLESLLSGTESASERSWLAEREKEKGNEHFRAREFSAAVDAYSLAIAIDGSKPFYFTNRANAYAKLKRFADSERDCSVALERQPNFGKALFRRASARLELGKYQEAFDDASVALEIDGGGITASKELVALHKHAFEKLREQKTQGPDGAATDNADSRQQQKEPARRMVIEEVEAVAESEALRPESVASRKGSNDGTSFVPANTFSGSRPGYVFKAGGHGLGYYADMQSDTNQAPSPPDTMQNNNAQERAAELKASADRCYRDEDYELAICKYTEAIDTVLGKERLLYGKDSSSASQTSSVKSLLRTLYNNRATCHMKCLRAAEAEADSCRAIDHDPEYAKAYHRRASARRQLGKRDEALRDYKVVLRSYPTNEALKKEIASLEMEMRRDTECDVAQAKVVSMGVHESEKVEAHVHENEEDVSKSKSVADRAAELKQDGNDIYRAGKFAEAAALYERSLALLQSAVVYSNVAQCRLKLNEFAAAEDAASRAIQIDPELVKAYYRRSLARKALNKLSEALEDLSLVAQRHNESAEVQREHAELSQLLSDTLSKTRTRTTVEIEDDSDDDDDDSDTGEKNDVDDDVVRRNNASDDANPPPPSASRHQENSKAVASDIACTADKKAHAVQSSSSPVEGNVKHENGERSSPETPRSSATSTRKAATDNKVSAAMYMMAQRSVERRLPLPKSHMDFERAIRSFCGKKEAEAEYLLSIDPSSFPSIFKEDISHESISTIVGIVRDGGIIQQDADAALRIFVGLTHVKRFAMVSMLMSKRARQEVGRALDMLNDAAPDDSRIESLRKAFRCT